MVSSLAKMYQNLNILGKMTAWIISLNLISGQTLLKVVGGLFMEITGHPLHMECQTLVMEIHMLTQAMWNQRSQTSLRKYSPASIQYSRLSWASSTISLEVSKENLVITRQIPTDHKQVHQLNWILQTLIIHVPQKHQFPTNQAIWATASAIHQQ